VSESLPPGAITPSLTGRNIEQPQVVAGAVKKALERAGFGSPKRVTLVIPDAAARVSLIPLEVVPSRPADLDQLIRWHVKKATPFPVEDAVISYAVGGVENGNTTFVAVAANRAVVLEYEQIADAIGAEPGVVDVSSLTVMNAAIAAGAPQGDWLLVCLAPDSTTLSIMRGPTLMFHRHRALVDDEPLSALVHQTAMYYEDRLGGTQFQRVVLSGGATDTARELAKREIGDRLQTPVQTLDSLVRQRGAA
jgi:type IV pilus assembly protein PilM